LFFPRDEAELSIVLKKMASSGIPVTIAGARTGLVGGCVPLRGALVPLERMNEIHQVYYDECAEEWRVRAQCAVSLSELNRCFMSRSFDWIEKQGTKEIREQLVRFKNDPNNYFYPPDPTELSASLGGTVATNASWARTYRYGATRNWVRRIRVMLPNGELLEATQSDTTFSYHFPANINRQISCKIPLFPFLQDRFTCACKFSGYRSHQILGCQSLLKLF
jgi:D-lactate dehydrogenase (cytochrome)